MLTGEVGTGKTTVSRKLLQQLPDNTQVAMILNPTLSALELLATVCDELGLAYNSSSRFLNFLTLKTNPYDFVIDFIFLNDLSLFALLFGANCSLKLFLFLVIYF